jgi:hypothetical protein
MRVNDRRPLPFESCVLERRTAEHGKAPAVVGVIDAVDVVKTTLAVEQLGDVHECDGDAVLRVGGAECGRLNRVADPEARDLRARAGHIDAAVTRQHQRDAVAEAAQRVGQRRSHFGQTAGLRVGMRLRGDHEN